MNACLAGRDGMICCGPHCQCSFLASRTQNKNSPQYVIVQRRLTGQLASRGGHVLVKSQSAAKQKRTRCAAWVVNSPAGAVKPEPGVMRSEEWLRRELGDAGFEQLRIACDARDPGAMGRWKARGEGRTVTFRYHDGLSPLRFHWREECSRLPLGVDPDNKLRTKIRICKEGIVSRCQVSPLLQRSSAISTADLEKWQTSFEISCARAKQCSAQRGRTLACGGLSGWRPRASIGPG